MVRMLQLGAIRSWKVVKELLKEMVWHSSLEIIENSI